MTKDQCCVLKHLTAGEAGGFEKIGELDDGEFLDALIAKGLVWMLDWAGEDETGDVGKFIRSRLDALQSGVSLDCDKIYARLEKEAKKEGFERGEMSAWQLDADEPSPRDEVCEVCGRVLFDADGNAMQPLEKEFI